MRYHSICPHCGRRTTAYTVTMNEGLARAFLAFASARVRLGRPLKIGEIGLENSAYTNFGRLHNFGLIHQFGGSSRIWEMTELGWRWLRGEEMILDPAGHMGGQTLFPDHPAWETHPARRLVSLAQIFPAGWRQVEDYREEAS